LFHHPIGAILLDERLLQRFGKADGMNANAALKILLVPGAALILSWLSPVPIELTQLCWVPSG